MIETLGFVAAAMLPLWNIPLMMRIQKRKSSDDISTLWTLGVWGCLWGMLPSGIASTDPVFKFFAISNIILFSGVVVQVMRFKWKRKPPAS